LSGQKQGGVVYVVSSAIAAGVAAVGLLTACGQQQAEPAAQTTALPTTSRTAIAVANHASVPPNAQGDPACAGPTAWGRDPSGAGVLVTYWSDGQASVTVLVRTTTGEDRAQRDMVTPDELRLFEFPDVDNGVVREVLLMTDTKRCFVRADPATFG
jgi:hypothetical protein